MRRTISCIALVLVLILFNTCSAEDNPLSTNSTNPIIGSWKLSWVQYNTQKMTYDELIKANSRTIAELSFDISQNTAIVHFQGQTQSFPVDLSDAEKRDISIPGFCDLTFKDSDQCLYLSNLVGGDGMRICFQNENSNPNNSNPSDDSYSTGIAYADEGFSFHKGLRFGMTSEEAIQFEKDTNGVDFSRKAYFELGDTISAKTTFANEDADMFLSFDDNKLSAAVFYNRMVFDTDGYYKNIEVFNSKYGEPISSSDSSFMKMPAKGYDAVELYGSSGLYYYNQKVKIYNMSVVDLSEYRVETTEGYYDIETILCSYTYSGYRCYSIITSYAYIDKDDYHNSLINETQQQQAEDQNRNDDL